MVVLCVRNTRQKKNLLAAQPQQTGTCTQVRRGQRCFCVGARSGLRASVACACSTQKRAKHKKDESERNQPQINVESERNRRKTNDDTERRPAQTVRAQTPNEQRHPRRGVPRAVAARSSCSRRGPPRSCRRRICSGSWYYYRAITIRLLCSFRETVRTSEAQIGD